jgi:hypothetical protein
MRHGAKDRAKTLEDIRKFVRIVRERTLHGFVLSGDVFRGHDKHGNQIPLGKQCNVSNENSLNIFIRANYLQVDETRGTHKGGKFIKWCGPNLSIFDLTDKFIKVRDEYKSTRPHRDEKNAKSEYVAEICPVEILPVVEACSVVEVIETQSSEPDILTQEYVPISREEFRKNVYGKPKDSSLREILPMLNEIYKHTKYIPKTVREVFRIEVPLASGVLEVIDIRDLFVLKEGDPRNSVLSVKLLTDMGILEKNDKYYHWVGAKPSIEMVVEICTEFAYLNYIVAEERKFNEAKAIAIEAKKAEEKRLIDEADEAAVKAEIEAEEAEERRRVEANSKSSVEEVKSTLPHEKVFEISSDEVNLVDFEKMTERELMILIYQNQLKNRELLEAINKRLQAIEEYQEKQSKNLVTVAEILSKTTV